MGELQSKTQPDAVKFCVNCGAEFNESATGNEWHTCGDCNTEFLVKIK